MRILYGIENNYLDITEKVFNNYIFNNTIIIPSCDIKRANIFGDPIHGIEKHIIIEENDKKKKFLNSDEIVIPLDKPFSQKYKIIFLIITSKNNNIYYKLKRYLFMNLSKYSYDINFFFIESEKNLNDSIVVNNHDIYIKCEESYTPGIFIKTIKSIEYINKNYDYDYLIRTNISSYFNINNIISYLEYLPKNNFATGFILNIPIYNDFLHGTSIILTKDITHYLYLNYHNFNLDIPDDVLISIILKSMNIKLNKIDEELILFLINNVYDENIYIPNNILYFRIKNADIRDIDEKYFELLYNKNI
jgi:hypothetical protein